MSHGIERMYDHDKIHEYSPATEQFRILKSFEVPSTELQIGIHQVQTAEGNIRYVLEVQNPSKDDSVPVSSYIPLFQDEVALLFPAEEFIAYEETLRELHKGKVKVPQTAENVVVETSLEDDEEEISDNDNLVQDIIKFQQEDEDQLPSEETSKPKTRKFNYRSRNPEEVLTALERDINVMLDFYGIKDDVIVQINHPQYDVSQRKLPVRNGKEPQENLELDEPFFTGEGPELILKELMRGTLLHQWEEATLTRFYQILGDKQALDKIVIKNLRLVKDIAMRYYRALAGSNEISLSAADIESEARIGLMEAINKFDPTKGLKLSTYATHWIKKSILMYAHNKGRVVRLPLYRSELLSDVRAKLKTHEQKEGREITISEQIKYIAEEYGLPIKKARKLLQLRATQLPIYLGKDTVRDAEQLTDTHSDTNVSIQEVLEDIDLVMLFPKVIQQLKVEGIFPDRYEEILRRRIGIGEERGQTLAEIAESFGVSREAIRQSEAKALKLVREKLGIDQPAFEKRKVERKKDKNN